MTGFELNVSRPENVIYFSIIAMPKKCHFIIFAKQNCAKQELRRNVIYHLYCWVIFKVNGV